MSRTVALFGSSLLLVLSLTAAHRECSFNDTELDTGEERSPHETNPHYIWPGGKIPYEFTSTVGRYDRELFKRDMKRIQDQSCFEFEPRNSGNRGKKYLEIDVPGDAPSCANGRFSAHVTNKYLFRGTKNALLLFSKFKLADQERCRQTGNFKDMFEGGILHEMFHALGIGHTQRRPDRNNYIRVFPGNIQNPSQYDPCSNDCKLYPQIPYECNSIMHYGYETFRKPDYGPTMKGIKCTVTAWGSSLPTSNDWKLVRIIGNQVCGSTPTNPGRWSAWQDHGYCSVTCGTGTQKQTRTCIGGTGCKGDSVRYFSCKKEKCEDEEEGNWWCRTFGFWC